jgi:hypothetical protein
MTAAAVLAALALQAGQPGDEPAPPPSGAPPTIDSLLDQQTMTEDERAAAVRSAYAAAQARRGVLDWRWRLADARGRELYVFQFSDPGDIPDPRSSSPFVPVIEGAWRDPRRDGTHQGSGFLDSVRRDGADLVVRFIDHDPDHPQVVTLHPGAEGAWSGAIEGEAPSKAVVMRRY